MSLLTASANTLIDADLLSDAEKRIAAAERIPGKLIGTRGPYVDWLSRVALLSLANADLPAAVATASEIREPSERAMVLGRLAEAMDETSAAASRSGLMQRIRDAVEETHRIVKDGKNYNYPLGVVAEIQARLDDGAGAAATAVRFNALAAGVAARPGDVFVLDMAVLEATVTAIAAQAGRETPPALPLDETFAAVIARLQPQFAPKMYCDPSDGRRCVRQIARIAAAFAVVQSVAHAKAFIEKTALPDVKYRNLARASAIAAAGWGYPDEARALLVMLSGDSVRAPLPTEVVIAEARLGIMPDIATGTDASRDDRGLVAGVEKVVTVLNENDRRDEAIAFLRAAAVRFSTSRIDSVRIQGSLIVAAQLASMGRRDEALRLWETMRAPENRRKLLRGPYEPLVNATIAMGRADDLVDIILNDKANASRASKGLVSAFLSQLSSHTDVDLSAQIDRLGDHIEPRARKVLLDYYLARRDWARSKAVVDELNKNQRRRWRQDMAIALADAGDPDAAAALWAEDESRSPAAPVWGHIGAAYIAAGDVEKARAILQEMEHPIQEFKFIIPLVAAAYENDRSDVGQALMEELGRQFDGMTPTHGTMLFDLAERLSQAGQPELSERMAGLALGTIFSRSTRLGSRSSSPIDAVAGAKSRLLARQGRFDEALLAAESIDHARTRIDAIKAVRAARPASENAGEPALEPAPSDPRLQIESLLADLRAGGAMTGMHAHREQVARAMRIALDSRCGSYVLDVLPEFARVDQADAVIVWLETLETLSDAKRLNTLAAVASLQADTGNPGQAATTLGWATDIIGNRPPRLDDRERAEEVVNAIIARLDSHDGKRRHGCTSSFRFVDTYSPQVAPLLHLASVAGAVDSPHTSHFLRLAEDQARNADDDSARQMLLGEVAVGEAAANHTDRACARLDALVSEHVRIQQMIEVTLAVLRREQNGSR